MDTNYLNVVKIIDSMLGSVRKVVVKKPGLTSGLEVYVPFERKMEGLL
jgi:hypothetical protein